MARIRTIKPEFFTSEDIVELEPMARLLYIALWCEADREGRLVWKPKTFKMRYFPADNINIDDCCDALVTRGIVSLYGDGLAYIPSFLDHQHINPRESESKLPPPNDATVTRELRVIDATVTHREEGKGKERSIRVSELPAVPDWIPVDSWNAWAAMRVSIKKPLTRQSMNRALNKLEQFKNLGHDIAEILDRSENAKWIDLYPPKEQAPVPQVHDAKMAFARRMLGI